MTRWLLNHIPTLGLAAMIIGGFVGMAVVGTLLVRKRLPSWASGEDNDVAGVLLGVVGGVYGIMLAFVIVALWESYQEAERTVTTEATEVSQLYRDTRVLPPETAEGIHVAIHDYLHHVIDHEWPAMKEGHDDAEAWKAVEDMYAVMQTARPEGVAQETFYSEAVSKLNDLVSARRERLHQAGHELPGTLQILLVGGAFVIVGFLFLFGAQNPRAHMLMVVAVSSLLAFNLLLAVLLDHPFAGKVSVPNTPFRMGALAHFFDGSDG